MYNYVVVHKEIGGVVRKIIALFVFLFSATGWSESHAQDRMFGPSVLLSAAQLTFDGEILPAVPALGISYSPRRSGGDFEIGLYGYPSITTEGGSYLATGLHVTFFKQFGFGLGVIPWREGTGVSFSGLEKRDIFFSVAYDLN